MLMSLCPQCRTRTEYTGGREGQTVPCRHCGAATELRAISPSEGYLRSICHAVWTIAILLIVLVALAALAYLFALSRPAPYYHF